MEDNNLKFSLGIKHQLFNNEVRKRRLALGLTQKQLGQLTGLGDQTIGHIETFRSYPTNNQDVKIAEALDTTVEILFPKWIIEFKDKRTTMITEHLVTERLLDHPELKLLPEEVGSIEMLEEKIDKDLLKGKMKEVLSSLKPREKRVLELRFGLEDGIQRTFEEVGKEFRVTRERIRQIEAKAIRKLKHPTRSSKLRGFLYG